MNKTSDNETLINTIRAIVSEDIPADNLASTMKSNSTGLLKNHPDEPNFTLQEVCILSYLPQDQNNNTILDRLAMSA